MFDRIMDLTPVQRDILTALINIHRIEGRAVKGEEIAELIGRQSPVAAGAVTAYV